MGGSSYSHDDYTARSSYRASVGSKTFDYDDDIKTGKKAAAVHPTLNPHGVNMREARDSDKHPLTLPIAVLQDVTGSMEQVPRIMQKALPKLMGGFLDAKASGKRYIGDCYPAILISAFDDYDAMSVYNVDGTLQMGQFESGLEIDANLTNLWLTGNGGGTYYESYDLALYFMARHTVHDHWEKRNRKGYVFLIGDEHSYDVSKDQVKRIIGDKIQADIPIKEIIQEVQQRYHLFMIIPNMTSHANDPELLKYWMGLLGQQHVLRLKDPEKICELIVSTVAINEQHVGMQDLGIDGYDKAVTTALVALSKAGGAVASHSAEHLPPVPGKSGGVKRV